MGVNGACCSGMTRSEVDNIPRLPVLTFCDTQWRADLRGIASGSTIARSIAAPWSSVAAQP